MAKPAKKVCPLCIVIRHINLNEVKILTFYGNVQNKACPLDLQTQEYMMPLRNSFEATIKIS